MLLALTAPCTSLKVRLAAFILYISISIWISLVRAPPISTLVISLRLSIRSCISSAYFFKRSSGISPDKLMYWIGISERSISITEGSTKVGSVGKSLLVLSTASLTFCLASLISIPVLNSTIIAEKSCTDLDVIFLTPPMDLRFFSSGLVTRFSISAGDVPGYIVLIFIIGITISGICSLGMV